jgi:polyisoprenoid-binding protein YceI
MLDCVHQHAIAKEKHMTKTLSPDPVVTTHTGTWKVDPGHAEVGFVGRHFGLTKIRGRFVGVDGVVVIASDVEQSSVEVVIDMASVDSGYATRDDHLRSEDLFDVAVHPIATYRSTRLSVDGDRARMEGELTIKGVTRPVTLDVELLGLATEPSGDERLVFSASGRVNREDWGLTWNVMLEAGGLLVSKEITLEIEVELIRA